MRSVHGIKSSVALAILSACLISCGGGGGGATPQSELSGVAAKGFVQNAVVTAKKADGSVIGTAVTNAKGEYKVQLGGYSGIVKIEVVPKSDGSSKILDEVDGSMKDLTGKDPILMSIGVVESGETAPVVHATPLTTAAATSPALATGADQIKVKAILAAISFQVGFPINATKPVNPREDSSAAESESVKKQALLLAGLANWSPAESACPKAKANGYSTGLRGSQNQFACAVEALQEAYKDTSVDMAGKVMVSIDGRKLEGFVQSLETASANPTINKTNTSVSGEDDSVREFAAAEKAPEQPTRTEYAFNDASKSDVDGVKDFFRNLRSNLLALDPKAKSDANDALAASLKAFDESVTKKGLDIASGQVRYLDVASAAASLLVSYEQAESNRPRINRGSDYDCFVVKDNVSRGSDGYLNGVSFASDSTDDSNTVICGIRGSLSFFSSDEQKFVGDAYSVLVVKTGANSFTIETESKVCELFSDRDMFRDSCLQSPLSKVDRTAPNVNSGGATLTRTVSETPTSGSLKGSIEGRFATLLTQTPAGLVKRSVVHDAKALVDFSTLDKQKGSGTFSLVVKNTDTQTQKVLSVGITDGKLEAASVNASLGSFSGQLALTTDDGELTGLVSLSKGEKLEKVAFRGLLKVKLTGQSQLTTLFDGSIDLSADPTDTSEKVSTSFNGALSLPGRAKLTTSLTVSSENVSVNGALLEQVIVKGSYLQDGSNFSIETKKIGEQPTGVTLTLLTSGATATGTGNDSVYKIKKGDKVLAKLDLNKSSVEYSDGLVEKY